MMDSTVLSIGETATVAEAIRKIRAAQTEEELDAVFVVDDRGKYVGDVRIGQLLTRPEQARIESLVDTDALYVQVDTNRQEVRELLTKHGHIAMPVVDHDGQLVGRIRNNGR
jgi:magnesium transporter